MRNRSLRVVTRWSLITLIILSVHYQSEHGGEQQQPKTIYEELLGHVDLHSPLVHIGVASFIVIVSMLKLQFDMCHPVSSYCTESFVLIIVGIIIGVIVYYAIKVPIELFNVPLFNYVLLPLIMMDAGWFFPIRAVCKNVIPVFTFAIIGSILNAVMLGGITYGYGQASLSLAENKTENTFKSFTIQRAMLYGTIVSAVDPVAVIAVFDVLHVNMELYAGVFGESLLNDGVIIVLNNILVTVCKENADYPMKDIFGAGVVKFFLSSLMGVIMGTIFATLAGFISKYSYHLRFVEPIIVIGILYMCYLYTESLHYSAIFAIIVAGILAKPCVSENISKSSDISLRYMIKAFGQISEATTFVLIGIVNISELERESIDWGFIFTLFFSTLVVRFIVTYSLTFVLNRGCLRGNMRITPKNTFIMAYSGLRGAISLALSLMMVKNVYSSSEDILRLGHMLNNSTMALVLLTVGLQGSSIKYIIDYLSVKKASENKYPLFSSINDPLMLELTKSMGLVVNHSPDNYVVALVKKYNTKYIRKLFVNSNQNVDQYRILKKFDQVINDKKDSDALLEATETRKQVQTAVRINAGKRMSFNRAEIDDELYKGLAGVDRNQRRSIAMKNLESLNIQRPIPEVDYQPSDSSGSQNHPAE